MNKSIRQLCIMFVLILPSIIFALEWLARYNGPSNSADEACAIAVDDLSNVHVTGKSLGSGTYYDYATVKYDSLGIEQWVARYNGPGNYDDMAYAIAVDDLSNVYVTGLSLGSGTDYDYATVKYDSSGIEQWVARYNGPSNFWDKATAIAVDNLGNVYVTGRSVGIGINSGINYDYATVKYDSLGIEQWVARYNGPGNDDDVAYAIAVDDLSNVYVTGKSLGSGTYYDYATVKYDSLGIEQWVARYNVPGNYYDMACAIAVDDLSNVHVTGMSHGSGTDLDYATVKYDSSGIEQWVARYNGPGNFWDKACAIAVDDLSNVYVTGWSWGSGTYNDYATVKYDSLGIEQWVARYNGPSNSADEACAIAVDDLSNVHVTGLSWDSGTVYDYATVKYDSSGIEQWVARYNGPGNYWDKATAIAVDDLSNVHVTGLSWGLGTDYDYATIKYSPTGIEEDKLTVKKGNKIIATIVRGPLQLPEGQKCKVYDITGRVVEPTKISPGIYFIEVEGVVTQKVVKVR